MRLESVSGELQADLKALVSKYSLLLAENRVGELRMEIMYDSWRPGIWLPK